MATKRKGGVKLMFVRVPYNKNAPAGVTQATFSDVADQFTNNPNPLYDPSKAPGSVKELSVATTRKRANTPGKALRGHAKAIKRTLFNQNAGKTLRRY